MPGWLIRTVRDGVMRQFRSAESCGIAGAEAGGRWCGREVGLAAVALAQTQGQTGQETLQLKITESKTADRKVETGRLQTCPGLIRLQTAHIRAFPLSKLHPSPSCPGLNSPQPAYAEG